MFLQFVKAYYEYLEEANNVTYHSRRLTEYNDIDETLDSFVLHFQNKYMANLPQRLLGDKRFLEKHILDVYRSKGSIEGLKLLFILLYNEEIEVYIPSYDILKASDGNWIEPKYLEISFNPLNYLYNGRIITGASSGAQAVSDRYEERNINDRPVYLLYLSSIEGTFQTGELVYADTIENSQSSIIIGSPSDLIVTSSDPGFEVGDEIILSGDQEGAYFKATISGVTTEPGIIEFTLHDGGLGYSMNAEITISTGTNTTGNNADFVIQSITNTSIYLYVNDLLEPYGNVELDANTYAANGSDMSGFANANANTIIIDAFDTSNITVGTIESIRTTNPGENYDGSVTVVIHDPYTKTAWIPDGEGGYWGRNANVTGIAAHGTGVATSVRILNSGFGYYTNGQSITFESIANSLITGTGNLVIATAGREQGFWRDTEGFLNSNKYLQDSFYYQEYSYEIKSSKSLNKYKNILKKIYHPVGNEMFGRPVAKNTPIDGITVESANVIQA